MLLLILIMYALKLYFSIFYFLIFFKNYGRWINHTSSSEFLMNKLFVVTDFHDHSSSHRSRRNRHSHPQNALRTPFINPFGFALGNSLMDDFFNGSGGGFSSFSSFNSTFTNGSPSNANVKRTSTSTRFVNGKKITTKK